MGRNKDTSPTVVAQMKVLREDGYTQTEIAQRLHVSQSVVQRCLHRLELTGSFCARKRAIKKRVTSRRTDLMIRRIVKLDPTASSSFISSQLPSPVSTRTIRRRLHLDFKLKSYKPACTPRLSLKNIKDRIRFCQKFKSWTSQDWHKVMFSDETSIKQFYSFSTNVRRPVGARYDARYCLPRVKHSPSVMIWGTIASSGRGALWFLPKNRTINACLYREILADKLQTWLDIRGCQIFQHDGAPCHMATSVRSWLSDSGIEVLEPWPGSSPDLNPIENCWAVVKKRVAQRKPTSLNDHKKTVTEVWTTEITS